VSDHPQQRSHSRSAERLFRNTNKRYLKCDRDGPGAEAIFVCQQAGSLRVIKSGALLSTVVVDSHRQFGRGETRVLESLLIQILLATILFMCITPRLPRTSTTGLVALQRMVNVVFRQRVSDLDLNNLSSVLITMEGRFTSGLTASCMSQSVRTPIAQTLTHSPTCSAKCCA